jgi:sec-independent protein translocase protein TatA
MFLSSPAEIFGVDGVIILVVVALVLFGSTQIPKLARSLGSAQKEFKQGLAEGDTAKGTTAPRQAPAVVVSAPAVGTPGTSPGATIPSS